MNKVALWLLGAALIVFLLRYVPIIGGMLLFVIVTYLAVKVVQQKRA